MQRNHLTYNPILSMAALALAIGAFILTVTGSLRETLDLALSREEATAPSITVRPLDPSTGLRAQDGAQSSIPHPPSSILLPSQEALIRKLRRVEGVQGVTATFHGSFKPEEERYSPARLSDTIQGTWSDLPGLEFSPSNPGTGLLMTGRLPRSAMSSSALRLRPSTLLRTSSGQASPTASSVKGPANINEAVLGYELAQRLGKKVGDTLVVNEHLLLIVGIWQPSILSPGNVVQVPYDTIRQWLPPSKRRFDEMTVLLAPGYNDTPSRMEVARRIWDQVPQVEVLSPAQEQAERRQAMLALDLIVLYSALLTVLVGGTTTLNAALMTAHEPSATSHQLVQPLLAALAGGLGGLLTGWLATLGLNAYTVHHQAKTWFIATPRLAGGVVLLSALVGLAAGVWPALWARLRPLHSPSFILSGLAVLGVALATPGVMLIGSFVESLYCSLDEGERVAADRIGLEPTSPKVAYHEPLADALRRWPGILGIAVESYGGAIVEDEERWIDRLPPSGVVYGLSLDPILHSSFSIRHPGVPYRVGLRQGRVFQPESLDEALIGHDLAAQQGLRVGDILTIRDHDFTVVGIRQRLAYGCTNDFNLRADVSLQALRRVLGQPYAFGTITAFIPPAEREEDRELFLSRLGERFSGTAVVTAKDRLAEIARDFPGVKSLVVESSDDTLLRARLLYFGLLAGVAIPLWGLAGLGIMSALRLSLAESCQEIRLRKLFSDSDGDILARWLERAAIWGGIGGLMGLGAGWLIIEAVLHSPFSILHPPLIVTPRLVVTTLVVAVLLGVIAGFGPAWQAARLSPLWEN